MCWGLAASAAMVAAGTAATAVTLSRGEPKAISLALAYFTAMEGLQLAGYAVLDRCGSPGNVAVTAASYWHIVFQPLVINAFAMAIVPHPPAPRMRMAVLSLAAAASAALALRLAPAGPMGPCDPATAMCAEAFCTRAGSWHIAWEVPLNGGLPGLFGFDGTHLQFPAYFGAVFVLPLVYGAWRFVAFHAVFGPIMAHALTADLDEMPAVWCLFSVFLLATGLSPAIRRGLLGARPAVPPPAP